MSTEALYQELILEHNRKPRNFREIPDADRTVEGRIRSAATRSSSGSSSTTTGSPT